MFISETQTTDNSLLKLQEQPLGFRWLGLPRPGDGARAGRRGRISGGIGFMVFNRHLRVHRICQNHNGALMVEVRAPECKPCAIIGVYNPPVTARCNQGYEFSRALLEDVGRMYALAQRSYDTVLLVGDFNLRLGSIKHLRASLDANASNDKMRNRFIRLCQQLDVLPLHGRPQRELPPQLRTWQDTASGPADAVPAPCTSKDLRAQGDDHPYATEVDYILAPRTMSPTDFRLGPDIHDAPGTHRPIVAAVRLPAAAREPQQERRQKSKLPLADYGDKPFWHQVGEQLTKVVSETRKRLGVGSLETDLELVQNAYALAARSARVADKQPGHNRHGFRHRFQGHTVPMQVHKLFDAARDARSRYALARRKWLAEAGSSIPRGHYLRRTWRPPPDNQVLGDMHARCKAANAKARKAAAAHVRRKISVSLACLEQKRVTNAHKFASTLQRIALGPTTAESDGAIPGDPAVFAKHFQQLHQETRAAGDIPGISTAKYDADLPAADPQFDHVLTAAVTPAEVALCKDPAHPHMRHTYPMPGHAGCTVCGVDRSQLQMWTDRLKHRGRFPIPNPRINCRLWGGKAPGSSGLHAEHLRFPRPNWSPAEWQENGMTSYAWRKPANEMLASMFSIWLRHGKVPKSADFVESVITPIHKKGDPSDPNNYRGIATGNVIPKLFGLVLLRRLTHWCSLTGVIPPNQAGFMPYNSAEHHVFALLETLKARARIKTDTYLLFLDLKKAYDSVHQEALWHVLNKLGVPKGFVDLLRDWNSRRPARVKINGQVTEEFLVTKGLPQGDVLSPLLFNLFISVLMRRIARDAVYRGVQFPGKAELQLKDLWYADDMVGLADSPQQVQYLLGIIQEWSADWGVEVGVGQGKTNAMHVSVGGGQPCAIELRLGGDVIEWTDTYRYLGYHLRRDLSNADFWQRLANRIEYVANQYLLSHGAARHLSVATQLQIFNTHVLGSINYLLPIIPLCEASDCLHVDGAFRRVMRGILGCHLSVATASIHADSRVLPIDALIMQHRLRFQLDLETTPATKSPAAMVYRALLPIPPIGANLRGRGLENLNSWVTYVAADRRRFKAVTGFDMPKPPQAADRDVHAYSVGVARMHAYAYARRSMQKRLDHGEDLTASVIASHAFLDELRHAHSAAAVDAAASASGRKMTVRYQAGWHYCCPADYKPGHDTNKRLHWLLDGAGAVTRLSAWAAGCDGSPIALSTSLSARQCRVIQYFRLGRPALTYWPFNQRGKVEAADGKEAKWSSSQQSARKAFLGTDAGRTCPFDGCGALQHNAIHFATSCTSPAWTRYQAFLRAGVRDLLGRMAFMLKKAHGDHPPAEVVAACTALTAQLGLWRGWAASDYRHVVMRLLNCATFSAYDLRNQEAQERNTGRAMRSTTVKQRAPPPLPAEPMPLSQALGTLFDSVRLQRSHLRKWANLWCQWAHKFIMALAGHYNCSRGFDRNDVPCFNHRARSAAAAIALHEVDNLAQDAAAVDSDADDSDSEPDGADDEEEEADSDG